MVQVVRDSTNSFQFKAKNKMTARLVLFSVVATIVVIAACTAAVIDESTLKLVQVQLVTRHGDRLPLALINAKSLQNYKWTCGPVVKYESEFYPHDYPNRQFDRLFFKRYYMTQAPESNCALGSLTFEGVMQHYELGTKLRGRYITNETYPPFADFLDKTILNPGRILIESSDIPRTIQSAQSLWQGMYPADSLAAAGMATIYLSETTVSDMYPNADV